jgi:hypothetical protein
MVGWGVMGYCPDTAIITASKTSERGDSAHGKAQIGAAAPCLLAWCVSSRRGLVQDKLAANQFGPSRLKVEMHIPDPLYSLLSHLGRLP